MPEWINIVITFLTSILGAGSIGWLFTIKEDRKAKQLENKKKASEIDDFKKDQVIDNWEKLYNESKDREKELTDFIRALNAKVVDRERDISELRLKLDTKNSLYSSLEMWKCKKANCSERIPPFGTKEIDD